GSLFAPDVLFLIPLPWWGPVISPGLIAILMVVLGGLAMARERGDGLPLLSRSAVVLLAAGAALCLIAFMAGPLAALPQGLEAAFDARNPPFAWGLYLPGLLLMLAGGLRGVLRGCNPLWGVWGIPKIPLARGGAEESYEASSSTSKP